MNDFCRRFGLETPILNAGMGAAIAGVELAAAVSEAGGGGVLGLGSLPEPAAREAIRALRARTTRAFGVNQILPLRQEGAIGACLEELGSFSRALLGYAGESCEVDALIPAAELTRQLDRELRAALAN